MLRLNLNKRTIAIIFKYFFQVFSSLLGYMIIMVLKRQIFPSNIVYYEGIIIAFLYYIFLNILIRNIFNIEKCIIGFLLCFNFWALVPTIIDRSVSITVIGSLRERAHSLDELNIKFTEKYVYKNEAVKKRLYEQESNGNIKTDSNNKYYLTKKGIFTAKIIEMLAKVFNVNDDFISL